MNKRLFYLSFFVVLFLGFFVVMNYLIPNFTKASIPPVSKVQPFAFINQDGETVREDVLQGKVAVVNYFFTTCKGICPKMNNNMYDVYEEFKNEEDIIFISHTCDPQTDSAAVLKRYSDSIKADNNKWIFLTGKKDSLYYMARHSYTIDDPANNLNSAEDDFLHTQFIALVNRKGEVVSIFDALKKNEMQELRQQIKRRLKEKNEVAITE